jgi:hypothetical protein
MVTGELNVGSEAAKDMWWIVHDTDTMWFFDIDCLGSVMLSRKIALQLGTRRQHQPPLGRNSELEDVVLLQTHKPRMGRDKYD